MVINVKEPEHSNVFIIQKKNNLLFLLAFFLLLHFIIISTFLYTIKGYYKRKSMASSSADVPSRCWILSYGR